MFNKAIDVLGTHGAPENPVTLSTPPPAGADEAWESVQAEAEALPAEEVQSPRVDLQAAGEVCFGVYAALSSDRVLRERMKKLAAAGEFDYRIVSMLPVYAGAAWYVRARKQQAEGSHSYAIVPAGVIAEGEEVYGRMMALASYQFGDDPVEAKNLASIAPGRSHRKLATCLLMLAETYERHPQRVATDRKNFRSTDEATARRIATAIINAMSAPNTEPLHLWTDRCARVWTLLSRNYAEVQSVGRFLLRATPDGGAARFPSLVKDARGPKPARRSVQVVSPKQEVIAGNGNNPSPTPDVAPTDAAPIATPPAPTAKKSSRRRR